ncbi:MAG: ribosome biogenesis GTPase Der [Gammaproteobacteria bacterium]|nr:ribosome biogenesis GTPase Der [Gammaproteobacteria bacterium]MDH3768191.1 ribosome biogenesis GTPase Der [Gammaproteobacteria bacterium]
MPPVIAIVGRPNVGKSTLFNFLTRSRDALVLDRPGLTRDRQYGFGRVGPVPYIVVDTGGLSGDEDGLDGLMAQQTQRALDESDLVFFMVDAREGLTAADENVATLLRRQGCVVRLLVNKAEGLDAEIAAAEFHSLGSGDPIAVSATHGERVSALMDDVLADYTDEETTDTVDADDGIAVAVIGRPNVGKSTLINRLIGEERLVAYDQPGTTRDSVEVPFDRDGQHYTLIDTAGVRRKGRVSDTIEKFSVIKALKAIDRANVVVAVIDAHEGVTEQDASLLGLVLDRGRALVIAINKWDGMTSSERNDVHRLLDVKLPFIDFAPRHFISALHGSGVGKLLVSVRRAYRAATTDLATPALTESLEAALMAHAPPIRRGRRPKLRYAHQGGRNPPRIVIHGTQVDRISDAYKRYLANHFRKVFDLHGTPVSIELRSGKNPFAGRRNKLTPRQQRKRNQLIKSRKQQK